MKKQLFFFILFLSVAFSVSAQITSLFVADDSDNTDNSLIMYQLIKATMPSMTFFNEVDSTRSPSATEMEPYDLVVWYCGSDDDGLYFWNGNKIANPDLINYLNQKGNLWLMGSGFLNDRYGSAPIGFDPALFVWKYLGIKTWFVETYKDDGGTGVPELDKSEGAPVNMLTLDTVNWKNPPEPYVDGCTLTTDASPLYEFGPSAYLFSGKIAGMYLHGDGFSNITFTFDPATMNTPENKETLLSDITGFYQDLLSDIDEQTVNHQFELTIYPNPAQVSFTVNSNLPGKVEYKLLDLTGTVLLNITSAQLNNSNKEIKIPVSSLSPGMYFLMADNGSVRLSRKVLVSR